MSTLYVAECAEYENEGKPSAIYVQHNMPARMEVKLVLAREVLLTINVFGAIINLSCKF